MIGDPHFSSRAEDFLEAEGLLVDIIAKKSRGEVLGLVRDVLAAESARVRGLHEALIKTGDHTRIPPDRRAVILCLNAAADVFTFALAKGQSLKDPRNPPDWLAAMVEQARTALMQGGTETMADNEEAADVGVP